MRSKKVLKAAYKLKTPDAGVFQITNNKNGRVLIEASPDIQNLWLILAHLASLSPKKRARWVDLVTLHIQRV